MLTSISLVFTSPTVITVNHISNEKKQTVLDCVTICANPMTWNTVITHMHAKNIPVKVKRWKQTERQTDKQIQTIAVPCLITQSVIKTTISLCSASYGGCKRDTARICCWLPCCCGYGLKGGHACCRCAVQQSIDINCPPGPQQQTCRTLLQQATGQTPYHYIDPAVYYASSFKNVDRVLSHCILHARTRARTHTHTHTRLTALF